MRESAMLDNVSPMNAPRAEARGVMPEKTGTRTFTSIDDALGEVKRLLLWGKDATIAGQGHLWRVVW